MGKWVLYNDEFLPAGKPVLEAGNRLLQYGDGLFETMRVHNGKIILEEYHFPRLLSGIKTLMLYDVDPEHLFNKDYLRSAVLKLCARNDLHASARVRLSVFRHRGLLIEGWPLESGYTFNTDPYTVNIFEDAYKSIDKLAPYKTGAYLVYALAAVFSGRLGVNDCLIQNTNGGICDSSIANVFYVKDHVVYTPSLSEGCINGVMRRHILTHYPVTEGVVGMDELYNADEIFLTNVIRGIQPVTRFMHTEMEVNVSREIFNKVVKPLTED